MIHFLFTYLHLTVVLQNSGEGKGLGSIFPTHLKVEIKMQ